MEVKDLGIQKEKESILIFIKNFENFNYERYDSNRLEDLIKRLDNYKSVMFDPTSEDNANTTSLLDLYLKFESTIVIAILNDIITKRRVWKYIRIFILIMLFTVLHYDFAVNGLFNPKSTSNILLTTLLATVLFIIGYFSVNPRFKYNNIKESIILFIKSFFEFFVACGIMTLIAITTRSDLDMNVPLAIFISITSYVFTYKNYPNKL